MEGENRFSQEPTTEIEYEELEKKHLSLEHAARSEAQEAVVSTLTPEQQKVLLSVDHIAIKKLGDEVQIDCKVKLDGEIVSVAIVQYTTETNGAAAHEYVARINNTEELDKSQSRKMFEFYYPLAEAYRQNRNVTNESNIIYKQKLADKLMGK